MQSLIWYECNPLSLGFPGELGSKFSLPPRSLFGSNLFLH